MTVLKDGSERLLVHVTLSINKYMLVRNWCNKHTCYIMCFLHNSTELCICSQYVACITYYRMLEMLLGDDTMHAHGHDSFDVYVVK
jgi:hypothetical protein